jgi:hypothetical protein
MSGYAGPEITGALTGFITYTGVLYWASAWPFLIGRHPQKGGTPLAENLFARGVLTYITLNLIEIVGVCAAVIVQRHHLFVWSVMAPRFLYAAVETVVITLVCFAWLARSHPA